uniref:EF-hand domain-containing protein n=1 Tax=Strongyloides venezuelensis TaxID=75913 RepID=A0A0K0FQ16_STRVS
MSSKDELREIFECNDFDKSGSLNLDETMKAINNLKENLKNPETVEDDFRKLAPNGELSFDDFCKLFKGF